MTKQKPLRSASAGGPVELPLRRTALALLIAACFSAAHANPVLPQVVHGQATFNQQGNLFTITNTPNTIINWQSFSVNPGEITRFLQQNAGSSVLNPHYGARPQQDPRLLAIERQGLPDQSERRVVRPRCAG